MLWVVLAGKQILNDGKNQQTKRRTESKYIVKFSLIKEITSETIRLHCTGQKYLSSCIAKTRKSIAPRRTDL